MHTALKILLVEDSRVDMALLRDIVTRAGHAVLEAGCGDEAVKLATHERPDLIFMDIVMQGEDGYDACRTIKHNPDTRDIPVVFVTSKNKQADRVWAELQGASGFISKPFDSGDILRQIEKISSAPR